MKTEAGSEKCLTAGFENKGGVPQTREDTLSLEAGKGKENHSPLEYPCKNAAVPKTLT